MTSQKTISCCGQLQSASHVSRIGSWWWPDDPWHQTVVGRVPKDDPPVAPARRSPWTSLNIFNKYHALHSQMLLWFMNDSDVPQMFWSQATSNRIATQLMVTPGSHQCVTIVSRCVTMSIAVHLYSCMTLLNLRELGWWLQNGLPQHLRSLHCA